MARNIRSMRTWLFLLLLTASSAALAAPPPLAAYGRLPALDQASLSPSGKHVAMTLTAPDDQRRIVIVDLDTNKALLATGIGDYKTRTLEWAGDGMLVVSVSHVRTAARSARVEVSDLVVLDIPGARIVWPLRQKDVLDILVGAPAIRRVDGRWYAYVQTWARGGPYKPRPSLSPPSGAQLSRIDLAENRLDLVARGTSDSRGWLVDAAGGVIAGTRYNDRSQAWSLQVGNDLRRRLARGSDRFGNNRLLGQGRTAGTVLYLMHDKTGAGHVMEARLDRSAPPQEVFADVSANRFFFDPTTQLLVGYERDGDVPSAEFFDPHRQARLLGTRKAFPGLSTQFIAASKDFGRLIVLTEGPGDSGTWWWVDIASGAAKELGWRYPEVKGPQAGSYRMLHYRAADGLEMQGVLTLPPGAQRARQLPLVVLPHGGPQARDRPDFNWWAQAFASRGYAVWQPNFRGSSGYGVAFRNAGFGEWGRKMQTDISDGVAELARQGIVDPKRACIVGASYGGYAALAGVTVQRGLYRCAVSVAGVSDLKAILVRDDARRSFATSRYWQTFMGVRNSTDRSLDAISPLELAARADAPVLLIHGKDDTVVPFSQSLAMQSALLATGKPVELIALTGEDHTLSRSATRKAMLEATVAFVQRHNPADGPTAATAVR